LWDSAKQNRTPILRQILTESMVLGGLGAVVGLGLASMLLGALPAIAPADVPRLDEVRMDGPVLWFALALAGVCTILFGLAPARTSSDPDLNSGLRQNSAKGSIGRISGRTRAALVVAEVALSVVLLTGAGLLLRSFIALTRVDLGFSTDRLLLTNTSIPVADENEARRATEFQRDLIERIGIVPGVRRAAGVRTIPLPPRDDLGPHIRLSKAFGIDWHIEYMHPIGRPVKIANSMNDTTGEPVAELAVN
jgi:putative ABC transport system permease protein